MKSITSNEVYKELHKKYSSKNIFRDSIDIFVPKTSVDTWALLRKSTRTHKIMSK